MATLLLLLLIEKGSHSLGFYDAATGRKLHTLVLPAFPHELVVDAAQRYAYITIYGVASSDDPADGDHRLVRVDLQKRAIDAEINCKPFNRLHGLRLDGQGRLFVLSEAKSTLLVFDHPETDQAPTRAVPAGGYKSHLFSVAADGQTAWVMNLLSHTVSRVRPFEPATAPLLAAVGLRPEGHVLSADEKTLFVACRGSKTLLALDATTLGIRQQIETGDELVRLYLSPAGTLLAANLSGRSLDDYATTPLGCLRRLPLGGRPVAVSVSPDGRRAYVSLDTQELAVVDLQKWAVQSRFATGRDPDVSFEMK